MSKKPVPTGKADSLRLEILSLARDYFAAQMPRRFVPGETYIPASGKVLDGADLENLLEASLDLWLTTGRFARQFEEKLKSFTGMKHVCLTTSGSSANLLAVSALTSPTLKDKGLVPGTEILTVAAGFPTTVSPIIQKGCLPVFVDVDLATANVDVDRLGEAVTPRTGAIVLAHTLGNPFEAMKVAQIAADYNLYLIEDCCDALGARFEGRPVGSFGDLATLSFYPAHQITTGEGGAVLTNQEALASLTACFRDWGRDCWCEPGADNTCGKRFDRSMGTLPEGYDHKYIYSHLGYNLKMTDMQAAIGVTQLSKAAAFITKRRENHGAMRAAFKAEKLDEHFILPVKTPGAEPSWFGFLLTLRDGSPLCREAVVRYLEAHQVGTRLLFGGNLTRQPAFAGVDYRVHRSLKVTDKVMRDSFWVGIWPGIEAPMRGYMIEVFKNMIRELVK